MAAPVEPSTETFDPSTIPQPYYFYDVTMTCGGCSGAVTRALKKNLGDDPKTFDVDLKTQKVHVWGPKIGPNKEEKQLSFDDVKAIIAKTGKKINEDEDKCGQVPSA